MFLLEVKLPSVAKAGARDVTRSHLARLRSARLRTKAFTMRNSIRATKALKVEPLWMLGIHTMPTGHYLLRLPAHESKHTPS